VFAGCVVKDFLNDFEIVPLVQIIAGTTFVFKFYMRSISITRSLHLYFRITLSFKTALLAATRLHSQL
jgi:hypothetical protein